MTEPNAFTTQLYQVQRITPPSVADLAAGAEVKVTTIETHTLMDTAARSCRHHRAAERGHSSYRVVTATRTAP
jgi:hypothetical protein